MEGYSSTRTSVLHIVFAIGGATAGVIRRYGGVLLAYGKSPYLSIVPDL